VTKRYFDSLHFRDKTYVNNDGKVDATDLAILLKNFGKLIKGSLNIMIYYAMIKKMVFCGSITVMEGLIGDNCNGAVYKNIPRHQCYGGKGLC